MSKRPLYTLIGFVVWKGGKIAAKRKIKSALPSPELLVAGAVIAGVLAAGANALASGDESE